MRIFQKYILDILGTSVGHGRTPNGSVGPKIRAQLRIIDWSKILIWKWLVYIKGHDYELYIFYMLNWEIFGTPVGHGRTQNGSVGQKIKTQKGSLIDQIFRLARPTNIREFAGVRLRNFIELYWTFWNFMELYGTLLNFMAFYGTLWNFTELYGNLWNFMDLYGTLWNFLELNGTFWNLMEL